jgi:hypothetical protein
VSSPQFRQGHKHFQHKRKVTGRTFSDTSQVSNPGRIVLTPWYFSLLRHGHMFLLNKVSNNRIKMHLLTCILFAILKLTSLTLPVCFVMTSDYFPKKKPASEDTGRLEIDITFQELFLLADIGGAHEPLHKQAINQVYLSALVTLRSLPLIAFFCSSRRADSPLLFKTST